MIILEGTVIGIAAVFHGRLVGCKTCTTAPCKVVDTYGSRVADDIIVGIKGSNRNYITVGVLVAGIGG